MLNLRNILVIGVISIVFIVASLITVIELSKETVFLTIENKKTQHAHAIKSPINGTEHLIDTDKGLFITSKEIYSQLNTSMTYNLNIKGIDTPITRREILSFHLYEQ